MFITLLPPLTTGEEFISSMGVFHNLAPTGFQFPDFPLPFFTYAFIQHANQTKPLKLPK